MTIEKIGVGDAANDGNGTLWRAAWEIVNKLIPTSGDKNTYAISSTDELVNTANLSSFFQWSFNPSISTTTDPGIGKFCLNNVDQSLATEICLSNIARDGINVFTGASFVQENSAVTIKKHVGNDVWLVFQVGLGGAIDETGFFRAPITVTESQGAWVEDDIVEFDAQRQQELQGVININTLADLPDPDGSNFIEIGGGINTYIIQVEDLDLGVNTLKITGGVVVIQGSNRYTSTIKSTSTNPLITIVGAFYADEFINIDNTNGPAYSYDADGLVQAAFVSQNCVIRDCTTLGTIKDANTVSLRTFTVVDTSVNGFLFQGTNLFQLNISLMLGFSWTGTLLDLGTSTWDIINWGANNRWISPSGTTIMSGLTGNGNLTASGRGIVDGNLFNGAGTAINGIDTQDIQWNFSDNEFADGTTQNSRVDGDSALFPATPPQVVTITTQGVYVAIGGTEWVSDIANRITIDSAGIATYNGLEKVELLVIAKVTLTKVGGGSDLICAKITHDTGSGLTEVDKSIGCTDSASAAQVVCDAILSVATGDKFQLFVANEGSTSNIEITNATIALLGR